MILFDPFSQSQFGWKGPRCTEGERARNQERVCLLEGEAVLRVDGGQIYEKMRAVDIVKNERKGDREIKEVREDLP